MAVVGPQLAPHLPAHPQQQHAAGKQQADDLQELGGGGGKTDAQHRRGDDAHEDRLGALFFRQAGCGQADHDGIVARQHQVDHDDLEQGCQRFRGKKFCHTAPFAFSWGRHGSQA